MSTKENPADSLDALKTRNAKVEADKAWETSRTRRVIITLGTYLLVGIYLTLLGVERAWFHALVPSGGYALSTLTLPLCKRIWMEKCYNARSRGKDAG